MNLLKASRLLLFTVAAAALAQTADQATHAKATAHALMPSPAAPGHRRSHAWILVTPNPAVGPLHAPGHSDATCFSVGCYYLPSDFVTAYATGSIANGNGGAGITVGIVDAYYNSQTLADCDTFSTNNSLPACDSLLTIVNQTGGSPSGVGFDSGWAQETDLDVQAVHGIAPNAKILLVACNSASDSNLGAGDEYAEAHSDVVTNSWGGGEGTGETADDVYLSSSTVPVLFSSGDNLGTEYPCVSIYALCIGGTSLITNVSSPGGLTIRNLESAWGGANTNGAGGGGCSLYISMPAFESGYSTSACGTFRGVPDISALADPYVGLQICVGTNITGGPSGACGAIGGTSLASPLTAGVIALIDADRVHNSKSKLGANLNALIYNAALSYHYRFYDVTTGTTGEPTGGFAAVPGWDRATGLGVILGPALATYLLTTP